MTCSHLVREPRQPIRGYSAPPNCKNRWFWPSGWVSHDECNSVYGYTLDKTYDEF